MGIGSLAELSTTAEENFSESDDSEKEDDIIKPDDNLILVGRVDGDASIFEIYGKNVQTNLELLKCHTMLPSIQ